MRTASSTALAALLLLGSVVADGQEHSMPMPAPQTQRKPAEKPSPPAKGKGQQKKGSTDTAAGSKQEPAKPVRADGQMDMQHAGHEQQPQAEQPAEQQPQMENMQHMGRIPTVKPEFPRLGKSQENPPTPLIRLEELEQIAAASNPTLGQAEAEIHTAKARQLQSGLYPNPKAGYMGEEIRGGSFGGGQQGFFASQTFVTGGKLGLNRKIFGQDVRISEVEAEEQRLRVMNAVRLAYYRVLAAQEMLDTDKDLLRIAEDMVKTARQLGNIGQTDDTEVLQAEVEQQRQAMAVAMRENTLRQAWRFLTSVIGKPDLEMRTVAGNLEKDLPELTDEQVLQTLVTQSPAVRIARASVDRAQAVLARERREPIPDIEVRGGLQQNRELLDATTGRRGGLQGFAEIGVQLYVFNRNQGNIQAARFQIERAQKEEQRVALVLRGRGTAFLDMYHDSRIMTERYRVQLLPRAQKAYELIVQRYGGMLASYPQVLQAQRTLFQLQTEYISALDGLWMNSITLQGLLLTDGLEAPTRPSDIDMPVREINVPMGMMGGR
jgi:cobalt-zinc-cadmium efflux system outer membrane protein